MSKYTIGIWISRLIALIGVLLLGWELFGFAACATMSGGSYEISNEGIAPVIGVQDAGSLHLESQSNVLISTNSSVSGPAVVTTPTSSGGGVIFPKSQLIGNDGIATSTQQNTNTPSTSKPGIKHSIYNVQIRFVGETEASITFDTDDLAKGGVQYKSVAGNGASGLSPSFDFSHTVQLKGLKPGNTYIFYISTGWQDGTSDTFTHPTYTFTTQQQQTKTPKPIASTKPAPTAQTPTFELPTQSTPGTTTPYVQPVPTVENLTAQPQDERTVILNWTNPREDFSQIMVVRSDVNFPRSKEEGEIVFQAKSDQFVDVTVDTSKPYFYSVFVVASSGEVSLGVPVKSNTYEKQQLVPDTSANQAGAQSGSQQDTTLATPVNVCERVYNWLYIGGSILLILIGLISWYLFHIASRKETMTTIQPLTPPSQGKI